MFIHHHRSALASASDYETLTDIFINVYVHQHLFMFWKNSNQIPTRTLMFFFAMQPQILMQLVMISSTVVVSIQSTIYLDFKTVDKGNLF